MRKIVLFSLCLLAATAGCRIDLLSLGATSPEGRYSLDVERTFEAFKASDTEVAEMGKDAEQERQMKSALSAMTVDLTIQQDKTWEGVFRWGLLGQTGKGTWDLQGEKLVLTTLEEDGHPRAQPKVEEAIY